MRKYFWLFIGISSLVACVGVFGKRVRGNGHITSTERSVSSFKNVEVSGAINVFVSQGDTKSVKIEGDENLLPYIEVSQEGDKIIVRNRPGYNLSPTGDMKVYVTAPTYNSIEVSGACNITGQTKIAVTDELSLSVSGAGDIKMEVDAPTLKAEVSGSGSIRLNGQTKNTELELTGAANAYCYDLLAEDTKVDISGAGTAEVYASVKLDAEVSGAGTVHYKGNATTVNQHVSGAGSVSKQ